MEIRTIQSLLDDLAKQEIPDDMTLWNEIKTQLSPQRPRPRYRPALTLSRAVAALAVLLVSAVSYGFYQQWSQGDPGLQAVSRANMLTTFNQTLPIEGPYNFEVVVEYAYADANRIAVATVTRGSAPTRLGLQLYPDVNLLLADGTEIPYLPAGGGGGGGGGPMDPDQIIVTESSQLTMFDSSDLEVQGEYLDVILEVIMAYSTSETNGGMLLGGSTRFEMSLPFNRGRVMDQPLSATRSDLTMTLQEVVVAPSLTRLEVCYPNLPPVDGNWELYGKISVGEQEVLPEQRLIQTTSEEDPVNDQACHIFTIMDALQDHEGQWQVTFTTLRLRGSEDPQAVVAAMAARGYTIEIMPEGGYMSDTEAVPVLEEVLKELRQTIPGPWVFTFPLPD